MRARVAELDDAAGATERRALAGALALAHAATPWEIATCFEAVLGLIATRRDAGVFYTPRPIAEALAARALAPAIARAAGNRHPLLDVRLLDPAVGCGTFLLAALEELAAATGDRNDPGVRAEIARRCLHGVDIDPVAVTLTRAAVARAAGIDPAELEGAIRHGDALVGWPRTTDGADPTRAELDACADAAGLRDGEGTPYVHWDLDFVEVLEHPARARFASLAPGGLPGFDVVIGNPPYVQEARGQAPLFRRLRRSPVVGAACDRMTDLFHLFVVLGLSLLGPEGRLAMITPSYWLGRAGAASVRRALDHRRLDLLLVCGDRVLFPRAPGHHTSILVADNASPEPHASAWPARALPPDADVALEIRRPTGPRLAVCPLAGRKAVVPPPAARLLEALRQGTRLRLPRHSVCNGVQSYPDRLGDRGVFVLTRAEVTALDLGDEEQALVVPFVRTSEVVAHGRARAGDLALLYLDAEARARVEANHGGAYDRVRRHLLAFAPHMTSRARPFGLHRPRRRTLFEGAERLLIPRRTRWPAVAIAETRLYGDESLNFLVVPPGFDRDALQAVLSSTLAAWFFSVFKSLGSLMQIDTEVLLALDLPPAVACESDGRDALATAERRCRDAVAARDAQALAAAESDLDAHVAASYGLDEDARAWLTQWRATQRSAPS